MNLPNVAQIYGVEDRALVMELVEGKTLKGKQECRGRSTVIVGATKPDRLIFG